MKTKTVKLNLQTKLPKVIKGESRGDEYFPVKHYSYSSLYTFATNPIMFRIKYINGDGFDSIMGISGVLGSAFHKAMEVYHGGNEEFPIASENDAIRHGLEQGLKYLENYNENFVSFSKTIPTREKAMELLSFMFNAYTSERPYNSKTEILAIEEKIEEYIDVEWQGKEFKLPVKLKGYLDKIERDEHGRIIIVDYKTTASFSDPETIDGAKIIQAIQYFFLVYAKLGEMPYAMRYDEVKMTKNRDGSNQVRPYQFVYEENESMFDFYFRLYEDVTRAISGEMVWVPTLTKFAFDSDVALLAYIHRLDEPEEVAKQMKALQVDSVTEVLRMKLESKRNSDKFLKTVEEDYQKTYKAINYKDMTIQEKIKTKLMEFGVLVDFEGEIKGHNVTLYRYSPSVGVRMKTIMSHEKDIEQVVGVAGVRVLAPIPNTSFIGVEVPNAIRTFPEAMPKNNGYELSIGVDVYGNGFSYDITEAPHMLVAGSTGSGKSIFMDSMIEQLKTCTYTDIHLIDPKRVEFAHHEKGKNVKIHLSEPISINRHLAQLVVEMHDRYETLKNAGVKSIKDYSGSMRHIFVFIDEYGDLIVSKHQDIQHIVEGQYQSGERKGEDKIKVVTTNISKEIEKNILLLSQMGRASGIHMIIATQRPSTDIISGSIKNNFPTKAVFRTGKAIDSQVVIDEAGAEKLLGKGDMLFASHNGIERLQGYKA